MVTTDTEKELIKQAIEKRSANKYKWAYLLFDMIEQRRSINISYADIANWLSNEGLTISENTLRKQVWGYKKQIHTTSKSISIHAKPVTAPLPFPPSADSAADKKGALNLNEELRLREKNMKDKSAGFDAFEGL